MPLRRLLNFIKTWGVHYPRNTQILDIQEIVTQALAELLPDPDEGLMLREDFETAFRLSLETVTLGGKTMAADDVAARLGLDW